MTYVMFDAAIAVLLLLAAWRGYRRGFILTLCGFLAIFVAFIGATAVSNALAGPVSRTIRPAIELNLREIFLENLPDSTPLPDSGSSAEEGDSDPADAISLEEALEYLKDSKLYQGFADAFQTAVNDGMVSASANAARVISDYIAKQIAQMALFLIAFILILVLWFLLSHALDLAFRLPVLSAVNRWTGAILGLFRGAALLFIACWLLKGSLLPQAAIQNSYLLNFFCNVSPLALLS